MGDTRPTPARIARAIPDSAYKAMGECADAQRGRLLDGVWLSANGLLGLAANNKAVRVALRIPTCSGAELSSTVYMMVAAATWKTAQFVYHFDPELRDQLERTPTDNLPTDALTRLPANDLWIEREHSDGLPGGVFVMLDCTGDKRWFLDHTGAPKAGGADEDDGKWPLTARLVLVGAFLMPDGGISVPFVESLALGSTVSESVRDCSLEQGMDDAQRRRWCEHIGSIISMVMFLCSEEPDISSNASPGNMKRVQSGKAPYHPTIHHVGYRIGAAFRKAKAEREASQGTGGNGASPAPHMRRAHWHTYWVGKENTPQRRQVVKWLPPIPVNVKSDDDIIPTIHRVSAQR